MSDHKVVSIEEFKRRKLNELIDNIKVKDFNTHSFSYLIDFAEAIEESDLDLIQQLCLRHGCEFSLTVNPVGGMSPYVAVLNTDPEFTDHAFDSITFFSAAGRHVPFCMQELAKDLRLYYTYLIDRGE